MGEALATKYQVFVSSTYEDLRVERDRVIQGILEMGHIPVGMEMFSAADEQQWQIIARHIEESDYYVAIIAHRYGSMDGAVSYTRKEYEYAAAKNIPTISFVIDPEAPWPADRMESDSVMRERLTEFKAVVQDKPVGYWTNSDDLYGKASIALMKAMAAQPRIGWVRATSAMGPEVTAELSRLSAENARLRTSLREMEEQGERDSAGELSEIWAQMKSREWEYAVRFKRGQPWEAAQPLPYSVLFELLAHNMVVEAPVSRVDNLICINSTAANASDEDGDHAAKPIAIPANQRSALLADFMVLDLMEPSTRRHAVADKEEYWTLTERGRDLLKIRKRAEFVIEGESASALG